VAESLRLEGILVAFPSRPVGLTQERGDFQLTSPITSPIGTFLLRDAEATGLDGLRP